MKIDTNTSLLVIALLVIAAGAYWYFFTGPAPEQPLTVSSPTVNHAQLQFEALVGELSPITFDTAIFRDARFNALVDITTPVAVESAGRVDPLAPIGGLSE